MFASEYRPTIDITQTVVTLQPGVSAQLIAANPLRRSLRWQVTGGKPATVSPGTNAAVVGQGLVYDAAPNQNDGNPYGGGSDTFETFWTPTCAFQAISTLGTTIVVWEGQ